MTIDEIKRQMFIDSEEVCGNTMIDTYQAQEYVEQAYNKAIDDFAEKAIKIVYEANNRDRNPQPRDMVADIHYKLLEIAEQLRAGGENEN